MTDFFSELEGHLHAAARRRARRGPRIALMAAATAAAAVLVFVALTAIDAPSDPEVAAPAPTVTTAAGCSEPPREVLDRFAVLRRDATKKDQAPRGITARLEQDFPGVGMPARVWPQAGRLARVVDGKQFWLFPVLLGKTCEPPLFDTDVPVERPREPGICWIADAPDVSTAICHALRDVERPISLLTGEGSQPYVSGLVPDGREPIGVHGEARVEGTTEGNIFYAKDATEIEEVQRDGCASPVLTRDDPAPELLAIVPGFRNGALRMPDERWRKALAGQPVLIHVEHAKSFGAHGGMEIFGVPYTPLLTGCDPPRGPTEAGACLIAAPQQSEYFAHCFTGTRIAEGRALISDLDTGLKYALVPAGTKRATIGGQAMRIEGDFAVLVTNSTAERMELER